MMPMLFLMLGGSLVKRVLVHDGAVGARLIQASIHARRDGGGAVKLLPSAGDLVYPGRWRFLRLGEEALHGTVLSLQSFWHHSQLSSLVVFVSFHSIVPQVATNRGPVTDLIWEKTTLSLVIESYKFQINCFFQRSNRDFQHRRST